jgi:hypothetical protein
MSFIHEFNIICLFSIYIVYYYETKLVMSFIHEFMWGSIFKI